MINADQVIILLNDHEKRIADLEVGRGQKSAVISRDRVVALLTTHRHSSPCVHVREVLDELIAHLESNHKLPIAQTTTTYDQTAGTRAVDKALLQELQDYRDELEEAGYNARPHKIGVMAARIAELEHKLAVAETVKDGFKRALKAAVEKRKGTTGAGVTYDRAFDAAEIRATTEAETAEKIAIYILAGQFGGLTLYDLAGAIRKGKYRNTRTTTTTP